MGIGTSFQRRHASHKRCQPKPRQTHLFAKASAAAARLAVLLRIILLTGCGPSEAAGLRLGHLDLDGGVINFARSRTRENRRYTADGTAESESRLKWSAETALRPVAITEELAAELRAHIADQHITDPDAYLFRTASGGHPLPNLARRWGAVRAELYPAGSPMAATRPYDLPHTHASTLFNAEPPVPHADIAERLGRSVTVLLQVYTHVLASSRHESNRRIAAALMPAAELGRRFGWVPTLGAC